MKRQLFICCYDIRNAKRLRRSLQVLKDYAGGGQYSVFECYLSEGERHELLCRMEDVMEAEDSFMIIRLQQQRPMFTLGIAVEPMDEDFFYLG
ncbi:CRISPR-associated endonuclease Cas2 [uncultured Photobacterium sp.]|uniref:CRISPR-associated endonuclease Cas2 n=1 Tax=uncultured Photobacterium sp. TaxID=173973 RepID=UPI002622FBFB|nr:CRISPR-associated endonuclease Cas2 [uncultured Photobacterium sp.]